MIDIKKQKEPSDSGKNHVNACERARKKKFLEDYFSICLEHGFCVCTDSEVEDLYPRLAVEDWPSYVCPKGWINHWEDIKKELRNSI